MDQNLNNLVFVHFVLCCFSRAIKAGTQKLEDTQNIPLSKCNEDLSLNQQKNRKIRRLPSYFSEGPCVAITILQLKFGTESEHNELKLHQAASMPCDDILVERYSGKSSTFIHRRCTEDKIFLFMIMDYRTNHQDSSYNDADTGKRAFCHIVFCKINVHYLLQFIRLLS